MLYMNYLIVLVLTLAKNRGMSHAKKNQFVLLLSVTEEKIANI